MYKYYRYIILLLVSLTLSGCEQVKNIIPDELLEDDNQYIGLDGVYITEFSKDNHIVRFFCDKNSGLIKLKVGPATLGDIKELNSPENVREAMKMPESDYIHIANGVVEQVVTIQTGPTGGRLVIQNLSMYIAGSADTNDDLAMINDVDFIYVPCTF